MPMPICEIRWIDCAGNPTPDTNGAVGIAVNTIRFTSGDIQVKRFPICAEHLKSMGQSHHSPWGGCHHRNLPPIANGMIVSSVWTFEPLPAVEPTPQP